MPYFDKILIANRGEIASRIIRTTKRLGIKTVAIFSDVDKKSQYVKDADEAYYVGSGNQGYLDSNKIVKIAKESHCSAIHPGYGFLSENPDFARLCESNSITFIGPSYKTMCDLSSKDIAKQRVQSAGIPIIPGYSGEDQSIETLVHEGKKIGFPLLVKAAYGGGGKGMKLVRSEAELVEQIQSGKREAQQFFGNSKVLLEKYFDKTRHIEVQIMGNHRDQVKNSTSLENGLCIFERDCSIQRRYQKIIEETPAPFLSPQVKNQLYAYSKKIINLFEYEGAGTVEFLLDLTKEQNPEIYFMEVNTRLQVEHKITEITTNLDLVECQLIVAAGLPLPYKQSDLTQSGCGLETRIYAEQSFNHFLPSAGRIHYLNMDPNVFNDKTTLIDIGVQKNSIVDISYDPMIAKVITKGKDRQDAIEKMKSALKSLQIEGIETNINFLYKFMNTNQYVQTTPNSTLLSSIYPTIQPNKSFTPLELLLSSSMYYILNVLKKNTNSPWNSLSCFTNTLPSSQQYKFLLDDKLVQCSMYHKEKDIYVTTPDQSEIKVELVDQENDCYYLSVLDSIYKVRSHEQSEDTHTLYPMNSKLNCSYTIQNYSLQQMNEFKSSLPTILSPMPAKVIKINVKEGDHVKQGDVIAIVEAMKMEHTLTAPSDGIVHLNNLSLQKFINKDELIAEIKSA